MNSDPNEKLEGMVDITDKPPVFRRARATGRIRLQEATIEAIRSGRVKKGDVLATARLAAILAVKDTPRLIPMCHPIAITGLEVSFELSEKRIEALVTVTSVGRTGVEMEALAGVSAALLNVWDMVKYLEKDESGNYPHTAIEEIRVTEKEKARN
ncbi:MAG: cyclic pyranopterin monophosphate synthase MoaC [Methanothrix sp.]|nr:cyclic pyranopterin monophosphate synthase MoaC [Methanothrix sp.]MDD1740211.1 cyclic pyranopterin monophosphate synthase MoaC [Methanothrix sp.]MDD1741295.1 cyclic pyranopterin monophosphate synthase MoaC [Methanothrix sp.]OYV11251.1 MAG: molybdenum cofactor biosynthesis protein C [Methanosaeta sp. ASM2]OYV11960.1 MAG: molybdenum cofactor biosynthesis protein C [Methanosaeta sp. ASO1]